MCRTRNESETSENIDHRAENGNDTGATTSKISIIDFYRSYFWGVLGIIFGFGISYRGLHSGLIEDPIGIFVPVSGLVLGINGAYIAYIQRNLEGNHLLRMLVPAIAIVLSAVFILIYVIH